MTCECTPARRRPDALETACPQGWMGPRRPRLGTSLFRGPQGDERLLSGCTGAQQSPGPGGLRRAAPTWHLLAWNQDTTTC